MAEAEVQGAEPETRGLERKCRAQAEGDVVPGAGRRRRGLLRWVSVNPRQQVGAFAAPCPEPAGGLGRGASQTLVVADAANFDCH